MTDAAPVWTDCYRVRAYEVGAGGKASTVAVCNWLQETAGNHATALGWAVDALHAQGRTWVLARLHLRLTDVPGWRDEVRVTTWPSGVHRLFALREFRVTAGAPSPEDLDPAEPGAACGRDGELCVATTGWLLVDLATRRPVRSLEPVEAIARNAPARVIADPFDRLREVETADGATTVRVRLTDLDMNGHANNVSVIAWALEALPIDLAPGRRLVELEVEFRAETRHGEHVTVRVQREPGTAGAFLHSLVREEDGREVARARSVWVSGPA